MIEEKPDFKSIHDLENFYKFQFKQKVGKVPGTTHSDRARLGQLLQQRGEKESAMLMETFFKMDDPWFKKLGYTLDCFFTNLNKVIVESQKTNAPRPIPSKTEIQTLGYCKNKHCNNRFMVTIIPPSFEGLDASYCKECYNLNA